MVRLLWRAILWSAVAGLVWYYTRTYNAAITVWLAKSMHALVGYPAPYLFGDEPKYSYFWHATMFPPVVGLTLASYWLRWPDRLVRAVVGFFAHSCLTATAVCVNDSPYLQQTEFLVHEERPAVRDRLRLERDRLALRDLSRPEPAAPDLQVSLFVDLLGQRALQERLRERDLDPLILLDVRL